MSIATENETKGKAASEKSVKSRKSSGGSRKKSKRVPYGIAHIKATFNNTQITITDPQGNVVAWSSAGSKGFSGSRKSTPFSGQVAAEDAGTKARDECGMKTLEVRIKGPGSAGPEVIKTFHALGFEIVLIRNVTGLAHNGPKPSKQRRV